MQASVTVVLSDFGQNAKEIGRKGSRISRIYLGWRMNCGVRFGEAVNSVGALEGGSGGIPSSSVTAIFRLVESSSRGEPNED